MSNACFYFYPELLDLIGAAYMRAHPTLFAGEVNNSVTGLQLAYSCGELRFTLLPPPSGAGNVYATVPVPVVLYDWSNGQRGAQLATGTAQLVVGATLGLQNGALVLTGLTATASGTDFLSQNAAGVFQSSVMPALANALAQLPQPQLAKIIGLSVNLDDVSLRGGVVWIDATVGDGRGAGPGIDPGNPPPGTSRTTVVCGVSGGVVGQIANGRLPISKSDSSSHHVSWLGSGYDLTAGVTATSVDVSIDGGNATGRVACEANVTGDTEVTGATISLPSISFDIGHTDVNIRLSSTSTQVTAGVTLTSVLSVIPSGVPDVISGPLADLLGGIAKDLTDALNTSLASLFTVFTLPPAISAFGIDATLGFTWADLYRNALVAVVAVSPTS